MSEQTNTPTPSTRTSSRQQGRRLKKGERLKVQKAFISEYELCGNIMLSCKRANIDRSTFYQWLEHDDDFSFAYNLAKEDAKDTLRAEIYRRAHEGWDEDVYQLNKFAGTVHKYSDTLLIFHAKMLMPEYRDKSQVDVNNTSNTPDVKAIQETIIHALSAYPEAKLAVAEALMEKSRERAR